jgi:hypothetical protein
MNMVAEPTATAARAALGRGPLTALLRRLAQQLRLHGEDVVEHAVDPAPLEAVLNQDARALERFPQHGSKWPVDALLASHLGLLEDLEAAIERQLPQPVLAHPHGLVTPP